MRHCLAVLGSSLHSFDRSRVTSGMNDLYMFDEYRFARIVLVTFQTCRRGPSLSVLKEIVLWRY